MPTNQSQRVLRLHPTIPSATPGARRSIPLVIVASPRAYCGKTFLARLVTDYLQVDGGEVTAFDLNTGESLLSDDRPARNPAAGD